MKGVIATRLRSLLDHFNRYFQKDDMVVETEIRLRITVTKWENMNDDDDGLQACNL